VERFAGQAVEFALDGNTARRDSTQMLRILQQFRLAIA
jgi:hypothetical protein